jgi:hypothetical protein
MKLNEWQLLGLVVGAFAAVIILDILLQYQTNVEFRAAFPKLPTAGFAKSRAGKMIQQEMTAPTAPTFADEANTSEEG